MLTFAGLMLHIGLWEITQSILHNFLFIDKTINQENYGQINQ